MSKAQLTKELQKLDKSQLQQLILDVYEARKEAREYFEFFLHPDVDKLYDKYEREVTRECERSKRGHSKARISRLRNYIKEFDSFEPGADYVIKLMLFILQKGIAIEHRYYCTDAFLRGMGKLVTDILQRADAALMFEETLSKVDALAKSLQITQTMRMLISEGMSEFMQSRV